ncbi:hypothetical protein [Streptomyces cellostaticus]|uniref:hypothetical protein n=1 Tax=Streptomyces cellostaticus TaxID=67285 RepID=UPI0020260022|nr:hypothetical protein [Streptomyces cellostaticus]
MNDQTNSPVRNQNRGAPDRRHTGAGTVRRLGRVAVFHLVRGLAAATGSALVAGITWWTRDH